MIDQGEEKKPLTPSGHLVPPKKPRSVTRQCTDAVLDLFTRKFGHRPAWGPPDWVQVSDLFRRKPDVTLDDFQRRYAIFLGSTDPFHQKQFGSLKYFCAHYDSFLKAVSDEPARPRESYAEERRAKNKEVINKALGRSPAQPTAH
jgi:hypothetical protein